MTLENTLMKALMDTLMGMGSVFMILILICIIISLFKFIPKESAAAAGSDEPKTAAVINDEEDDGELIAVITAALKMAMAQEAPPDTGSGKAAEPVFIVKSVKRRR
ncbi:MAG: hypothetical protein E7229_03725 [Clostridiales bacterium]|jgi:sodium pump decarboxylase gamma subunit|nr:hypothetical protein [Clostridiales bacterium]MBR6955570.1 OadG family protein [Bacillota bacterium]